MADDGGGAIVRLRCESFSRGVPMQIGGTYTLM